MIEWFRTSRFNKEVSVSLAGAFRGEATHMTSIVDPIHFVVGVRGKLQTLKP